MKNLASQMENLKQQQQQQQHTIRILTPVC